MFQSFCQNLINGIKQRGLSASEVFTKVSTTFSLLLRYISTGKILVNYQILSRARTLAFRRRRLFAITTRPAFIKFMKFATR